MSPPGELDDLTPQQYRDIYHENDVPLSDVRTSALRVLLYVSIGLLIAFAVLGNLITIPRYVRLPFVLKGTTQEQIYRFPDNVYIDALHVTAGQHVLRGQKLASITSPRIASLIAAYNGALEKRGLFVRSEIPLFQARKESARLQAEKLDVEIGQARRQQTYRDSTGANEIRALAADAGHARRLYLSDKDLFAAGSVSEMEMRGAEARSTAAAERLREARTALEGDVSASGGKARTLALDRDQALAAAAELDAEIAQRRAALDTDIAAAANAIELNYGAFNLDGGSLQLVAPADGVVSFLFDGERELAAGAMLLKVMAGDSDLYAFANAAPVSIGLIARGQPAMLEVATFPHFQWGVVRGAVAAVSLTSNEKGEYPLRIAIGDAGRMRGRLRIGMSGELGIVVEERTLFQLLFDNVSKTYHDATD